MTDREEFNLYRAETGDRDITFEQWLNPDADRENAERVFMDRWKNDELDLY